jgi:hypothetical protein
MPTLAPLFKPAGATTVSKAPEPKARKPSRKRKPPRDATGSGAASAAIQGDDFAFGSTWVVHVEQGNLMLRVRPTANRLQSDGSLNTAGNLRSGTTVVVTPASDATTEALARQAGFVAVEGEVVIDGGRTRVAIGFVHRDFLRSPASASDAPIQDGTAPIDPAPAERVVPPPTTAKELISKHTFLLNLDERALGSELSTRAQAGQQSLALEVLDELGSTDRDDVALEFMRALPDSALLAFAGDAGGRALLDRLFDELTSGKVDDEKTQADRILSAKPLRTTPAEFDAAALAGTIKIFPFRLPGITVVNPAPIRATIAGNDRIRVKLLVTTFGVTEFKKETKTLPLEVALSGLLLPSDEIVGVRFYDLGGQVQFMKALRLVELSNQNDQEHIEKFLEVSAVAATLGAGALGAAGVRTSFAARGLVSLGLEGATATRLVLAADRAAFALGVLSSVLREHRGFFIARFGAQGSAFVRAVDVVNGAVALFGLARVAIESPRAFLALRDAYRRLRGVADPIKGALDPNEKAALDAVTANADELLKGADEIQAAAKPPGAASPTRPDAPNAPRAIQEPPAPSVDPRAATARTATPTKPMLSVEELSALGYRPDRIFMDFISHPVPSQGWKLHVSADVASAARVAEAVLPALRRMGINHKVVRSLQDLAKMSRGQQGKFITIYPDDDAQALRIAAELDGLLSGLGATGPGVVGEASVGSSGLLYSRYGGFTKDTITDPSGIEVADVRGQVAPPWLRNIWTERLPPPAGDRPTLPPGGGGGGTLEE